MNWDNSIAMDSAPVGESSVGVIHKWNASAGRESEVPFSLPDNLDLIPVGRDRAIAPERRDTFGCLHGFNRVKADIPVEQAIFYPDPILKDINLCGKNEPVDEKDKRGSEKEHDRDGMKGYFHFIGDGIFVVGRVVEKGCHGNHQNDWKCEKDFNPEFILDSIFKKNHSVPLNLSMIRREQVFVHSRNPNFLRRYLVVFVMSRLSISSGLNHPASLTSSAGWTSPSV